jgi:AhpD family alkylhydroperoxidase
MNQEKRQMATKKRWYMEASPDLGNVFKEFHDRITGENSLDRKTMELIKTAVSCVLRCSHCTEDHIKKALKEGATKREIADTLLITALQGAGTQLYWLLDRYETHLGAP